MQQMQGPWSLFFLWVLSSLGAEFDGVGRLPGELDPSGVSVSAGRGWAGGLAGSWAIPG